MSTFPLGPDGDGPEPGPILFLISDAIVKKAWKSQLIGDFVGYSYLLDVGVIFSRSFKEWDI